MSFYTDNLPIIACSTGTQANTAIAVIRLSGFSSLIELQPFFSFSLLKVKPRYSHLTNVIFNTQVFDNGLMVFFPQGESYTGENVLELSVHGNLLNIQRILDLFIQNAGFRDAHPGEFTYRALKNKNLSLSQVEGLDMLLNANSNLMLTQGLDILQGELHAQYLELYESFIKLKASIELSIDFSEDVGEEESRHLFLDSFIHFSDLLDALHVRTQGNLSSLLSPEVVLVGQTNAGKSSLFNLLVKQNRSIVSNIAGTTRDYISELIHIDGTNYKLVDTAGIRDSQDTIENIGIERAFEILERAFFRILIINPFETNPEYINKLHEFEFDLLLFSHWDKEDFSKRLLELDLSSVSATYFAAASFESGSIEPLTKLGPIEPLTKLGPIEPLTKLGPIEPLTKLGPIEPLTKLGPIEPLTKLGPIEPLMKHGPIEPLMKLGPIEPLIKYGPIEPLSKLGPIEPFVKNLIVQKFKEKTLDGPILIERHRGVINKLYLAKSSLSCKIKEIGDVAILSSEVNIFANHLSELIGVVSPDDVLNSIFSNFCIGK
jgi:tRNA modification GTPase